MPRGSFRNRAPIGDANRAGRAQVIRSQDKEWAMTELEQRLAEEREEIAARVASFRATQERFAREREEYFVTTLQSARGIKPLPFWS
jgi:hypothetical protein